MAREVPSGPARAVPAWGADRRLRRLGRVLLQPVEREGQRGRLDQRRLQRRAAPAGRAQRHCLLERRPRLGASKEETLAARTVARPTPFSFALAVTLPRLVR